MREEDEKLRQAVELYGARWSKIAEAVGTRNGDQCWKRWYDCLDPRIDKSPWTAEEVCQCCPNVAPNSCSSSDPTGRKTPPPRLPTRPQLERHRAPALPQPHLPRRQEPIQHPTAQARGRQLKIVLSPTPTPQSSHFVGVQPIPQRPHHAIQNSPVHPGARVYIRGLDGPNRCRDWRVS